MADANRYDVVLFGATGFTGKLVASYLNEHTGSPRWAIAGRSKDRLAQTHSALKLKQNVGIIEADNKHPEKLAAMARQAKCIINVVGPFRQLGAEQLVQACIAEKSHYVDLSGESLFNEQLIEKYHEKARQAGVAIVPSVGLDSLPSDLTTYLAVQHLKREMNAPGAERAVVALGQVAPFSTGTLLSACDMVDEDKRQLMFVDPGRLATQQPKHEMDTSGSVWLPQFNGYGGAYVLSPHNIRTVYRTWSLLQDAKAEDAYGPQFEAVDTLFGGSWLFSQLQSGVQSVANVFLLYVPGVRSLLRAIAPSGAGPSVNAQRSTKTDVRTIATYAKKSAICTFQANGDPGYYMTARMITESALALALNHDKLHPLAKKGGVLTAATIGAEAIADRLRTYASFEIFTKDFLQA